MAICMAGVAMYISGTSQCVTSTGDEENGYVPIAPFLVSKTEVGLLLSAQAFAGATIEGSLGRQPMDF